MVDKKLIHWDEPLCRYLNGLKDGTDNEKIKIGHVFLHRTGYTDIEQVDPEKVPPCEAYRELIKKPPLFKPGAFFKYSSMTYWFINALVREVLGFESMDDFLKEWLFAPCGMENTTFHPVPGMAVEPHYLDAEGMEKYMGLQIPGSGLWSCPDDLLSFGDAVLTPGKLFSEETFREMTEGYPMEKFDGGGFSCRTLGWVKEINFNNQPQRGFFHGGATGGVLWLDPEARAVILFMAGKWGTGNDDAFNVINSFYGE
jgi:CubicO group peptidase (beta-lactamase class C family)